MYSGKMKSTMKKSKARCAKNDFMKLSFDESSFLGPWDRKMTSWEKFWRKRKSQIWELKLWLRYSFLFRYIFRNKKPYTGFR